MKCLVLAGGSGDRLWPLSRKNYPKQFMNINQQHSLFQETITRNMKFCDEFLIVTNKSYEVLTKGQLNSFQGIRYRLYLEEQCNGTAWAIANVCMDLNPSEIIYVVASDQLVSGEEYAGCVFRAKELALNGYISLIGIKANGADTSFGYICHDGEKVLKYREKPQISDAENMIDNYDVLWNGGMFACRVGDLLRELKKYSPEIYHICKVMNSNQIASNENTVNFDNTYVKNVQAVGIETAIFERSKILKAIEFNGIWQDVCNFETYEVIDTEDKYNDGVLDMECSDITIINRNSSQLIVTNKLKNILIVNTEDAIYISDKNNSDDIKEIVAENYNNYKSYFDSGQIQYRPWGTRKILDSSNGYRVRKLTIYPGCEMSLHEHEKRNETWSVVKGIATVILESNILTLEEGENINVPAGVSHKICNNTDFDIEVIEVGYGEDIVKIYEKNNTVVDKVQDTNIIKLIPAYKDYLWGGNRLREIYGKDSPDEIIAESWELSANKDGQSIVSNGAFAGMEFGEYLKTMGKGILGWKCQYYDRFPILIKYIDARQALSIQVHPDDDYAFEHEDEFGKNEMWYIIDCEPNSLLYCGLKKDISKNELKSKLDDGTIIEVLNEISVKPGDVLFVQTGTIHAIGAGIILCEIQQNSNSTYRLFDYNRKDRYGNPRELHIGKALDVVNTKAYVQEEAGLEVPIRNENSLLTTLSRCKYFECVKYDIDGDENIHIDDSTFKSIIVIEGEGIICCHEELVEFKAGDSYFIPAGRKLVRIIGKCQLIVTNI